MRLRFTDAKLEDVPLIAGVHNAAAGALTAVHGAGPWSSLVTERGVASGFRNRRVRVGKAERRIHTVLSLGTRKPWSIDTSYFTPVDRPIYLTGMAVWVACQRAGLGRQAIEDARRVAIAWPADAIRLDAWDADAGAGQFYEKCGFEKRGNVTYKGNPLVYYEYLLSRR